MHNPVVLADRQAASRLFPMQLPSIAEHNSSPELVVNSLDCSKRALDHWMGRSPLALQQSSIARVSMLERSISCVSCPVKDGNTEGANNNIGASTNAGSLLTISPKCSIASTVSGGNPFQLDEQAATEDPNAGCAAAPETYGAPVRKRSLLQSLFTRRKSSAMARRSIVDNPLAAIEIASDSGPVRRARAHHMPLRARFHRSYSTVLNMQTNAHCVSALWIFRNDILFTVHHNDSRRMAADESDSPSHLSRDSAGTTTSARCAPRTVGRDSAIGPQI